MAPEQAEGYLAAMIDGEGYIRDVSRSGKSRQVQIANTERSIIDGVLEACAVLGIAANATGPYFSERRAKKPIWIVNINHRDNFERLATLPLRSENKRQRLDAILALYDKGYRLRDPISHHDLHRLYVEQAMTIPQVAAAMGVGVKRVILALRRHGIPGHTGAVRSRLVWDERRRRAAERAASLS